jgi:competence protein ComEA
VRGLLIASAIAGAIGLLILAPSGDETPVPLPPLVVDPNTVSPQVLKALPRLGPALVSRIISARNEAPFRSIEDLDARVAGVGPATINALRPHLRIEPLEGRNTKDASLNNAPNMAHYAR